MSNNILLENTIALAKNHNPIQACGIENEYYCTDCLESFTINTTNFKSSGEILIYTCEFLRYKKGIK